MRVYQQIQINVSIVACKENSFGLKRTDYLSDMFQWNYGALKCVNDSISSVSDKEIIDIMEKSCELFDDNLNTVLDILGGISYE